MSTTSRPVAGSPVADDAVVDLLRRWVRDQRWFPAKDGAADEDIQRIAVVDLVDPTEHVPVQLHLLRLGSGAVLQVPTTMRSHRFTGLGMIGTVPGGTVVDGCHDPAFVRAWLANAEGGEQSGDLTGMQVLGQEQSNTSVLLPGYGPPAILKVFRSLTSGPNPDVDTPLALAHVGWTGVPRPLAWLAGTWPAADGPADVGHLGVLSQLVSDAEDGFELAVAHARSGTSFADHAAELGRTTAELHAALRAALPVAESTAETVRNGVLAALTDRARTALAAVPVLTDRAAAVDRVHARIAELEQLPPVQRVHGDLHLGQVLRSGTGHWYVLDFEGEPQATAAEKARPDLALRDLAGMLRSIDYAAAIGGAAAPSWPGEARRELVAAYREYAGGPTDEQAVLLHALELDKALYEVVYESRHRPEWVEIPLAGVDRLLQEW